ncbi:MAG TPA: FxLYD domain-containing protein [Bryobacteraceae bacterium]|jgi:hypothetical protein|nr:FxLYD domain-containing protein [Bryobacteraceae bacterium]
MSFLDRVDAVARKIERFVGGSGPSDPLYISNRTFGQKARLALLIGLPMVAVGGLIVLALGNYFDPAPSSEPPAAAAPAKAAGSITANVLPNLAKDYRSESDGDCEVAEAVVGNQAIIGKLRNKSARAVSVADVIFDVTDADGSALGAVAVRVENIPPHGTADFHQTIEQHNAKAAIVREVHTR